MSVTRSTYALEQLANVARADLSAVLPKEGGALSDVIRRVVAKRSYTAEELAAASADLKRVAQRLDKNVTEYLRSNTPSSTETAVVRTVFYAVKDAANVLERKDGSSEWWNRTVEEKELALELGFYVREATDVLGAPFAETMGRMSELVRLLFLALNEPVEGPLSAEQVQLTKGVSATMLQSMAKLREQHGLTPEQDVVVAGFEHALRRASDPDKKPPVVFENPVAAEAAKPTR